MWSLHPGVFGGLDVLGLAGPAAVPVKGDLAPPVGGDRGVGRGSSDRPVVEAVREDHQVGREPVAADVRSFPHLPAMFLGEAAGERAAEARAADVPAPVRADEQQGPGDRRAEGRGAALGQARQFRGELLRTGDVPVPEPRRGARRPAGE